ncbi:MAG: DoxX family protein [Chitinophagales bacterium]|jgi:putative oxidoreductase|nr:DoxX family protein [Chitinophagales bacterium]
MLNKYSTDYGLLIIRLGIGILFMLHGYPKITGGPEMWSQIGGSMGNIGIHFAPTFWGFMAAFAEFVGGACLVLGFLFRPALAMLIFTMFIAGLMHYTSGDGFNGYNHALESGLVFLGLFIAGPGKYALKIVRR